MLASRFGWRVAAVFPHLTAYDWHKHTLCDPAHLDADLDRLWGVPLGEAAG